MMNKDWKKVKLGEVCELILSGGTPSTKISEYWEGNIPWMTSADIVNIYEIKIRKFISQKAVANSSTNLVPQDNIIVVTRVGLGKIVLNKFDVCISQDSQCLVLNKKIIYNKFLLFALIEPVQQFKSQS